MQKKLRKNFFMLLNSFPKKKKKFIQDLYLSEILVPWNCKIAVGK